MACAASMRLVGKALRTPEKRVEGRPVSRRAVEGPRLPGKGLWASGRRGRRTDAGGQSAPLSVMMREGRALPYQSGNIV